MVQTSFKYLVSLMINPNHVTWIDSFPVTHYQISQVMLLRFGKSLRKAENVIKGMDRTRLLFSAKITVSLRALMIFEQKSCKLHGNRCGVYRACWNWKCIIRMIGSFILIWRLRLFSCQGSHFYKCHTEWCFCLARDWSKNDVSAMLGLLLWD